MGSSLFNIGMDSNRSQFMARQRIESLINLPRLFAAIDADPAIVGAGVVYIDADFNVVTLREFQPICSIAPKRLILREAQKYIAPTQFAQQVQDNPRESRLVGEAVNTTLSCAARLSVGSWCSVVPSQFRFRRGPVRWSWRSAIRPRQPVLCSALPAAIAPSMRSATPRAMISSTVRSGTNTP